MLGLTFSDVLLITDFCFNDFSFYKVNLISDVHSMVVEHADVIALSVSDAVERLMEEEI